MNVGSINVTRVTHNLQAQSVLESLRRGQLSMFLEQSRLSIGRRYATPSDDPVAASQSLNLTEILDQQDQLARNVQHGDSFLTAADDALTDVNDLLVEAHSIASQNLGSLASADERLAAAEVVSAIVDQLRLVANRQFQGRYLFAGLNSGLEPFTLAPGGTAYVGDANQLTTRVAQDELDAISFSGDDVFGALSGRVEGSVDLSPILPATARLEDLSGANGRGIRTGELVVNEEGGAGVFYVDLSTADTISDVVDLFNEAASQAGASVTASLSDNGLVITPGGAPVAITDTSTGLIASDLGILTPAAQTAAIVGADLNVRLTATTHVSDLMNGAGLNLDAGILIQNGDMQAVVDLSGAEMIQDILNRINNAGVHVRAEINAAGTGIDVINLISGTQMSIGENGGTTATDLGIRSLDLDTPLSELNNGQGVATNPGEDDLRITAKDGSFVDVNLDGAETIGDVIDAINEAASAAGVNVTASLAETGNGIRIADNSGGAGELRISRLNLSYAIDDLGLDLYVDDPATEMVGNDPNMVRAESVFTALYDLERALRDNDETGITDAAERVNSFMEDLARARGVIGARSKGFQDRLAQMDDARYATEEFLSKVRDLDYTESITKFQQAQTALQASLMTGSNLMSLSLMDYL